jgi:phage I-like protein
MNGNKISTITMADLEEIVRVFYARKNNDMVVIDWNHASSPYASSLSSPDVSMALGQIADLEVKNDGLYAYPLYTAKGAQIVEESEGNLWSSPEFIIGPVYARDGGNKIGDAQLLAVTLTPRPAQSQSKIDRILLTEKLMDQTQLQGKSPDELIAMLLEKDALVKQLEAKLSAIEAEYEAAKQEDAQEPNEPMDSPMAMGCGMDNKPKAMSEASVKLMNEMSIKITALNEQVSKLQAEKHGAERKNAIDALLNTGKIVPSEKAVAEEAYDLKDKSPSFWRMFSERQANQAVNLSEVGHAEASKPISLSEQVRSIQKEKGITFAQALDLFKNENPQAYKQYFGV